MEIITRYIVDKVEIDENTKSIGVRSRAQRWVLSENSELLVQDNAGYHRVSLDPGDWSGADRYGVRNYADLVWTQEVVDAWNLFQSQNSVRPWPPEPPPAS